MTPSEFRENLGIHKTRINGISCGEEIMTRRSAVLIPCQRVTDRQTDSIVDARKNGKVRSLRYKVMGNTLIFGDSYPF